MGDIEKKLAEMGYQLPPPFKFPKPNRTGCVQVGNILFVSGHGRDLPTLSGVRHSGKVPADVSEQDAYTTARVVGLSMLASLKQHLGELDRIRRLIRLFGMVNVSPGFDRMPQVIDGASDFFFELLGPVRGQHARSAIGVAELPHGIPVEINGEFEVSN